jgi:hypothetical protein
MADPGLMNITALIAYFGGETSTGSSSPSLRPGYLQATLESTAGELGCDFFIGMQESDDYRIPGIPGNIPRVFFDCEPRFLPANLARWGQEHVPDGLVYLTEADQILHMDPAVLNVCAGDDYLSPHRLEQIGPNGGGADRGPIAEWDGRDFYLPNGTPAGDCEYYHPEGDVQAYGAAFLAGTDLFRKTEFVDSDVLPTEHTAGFDINFSGNCLKTGDLYRFFVEHLSGYEYHQKLDGSWEDYHKKLAGET